MYFFLLRMRFLGLCFFLAQLCASDTQDANVSVLNEHIQSLHNQFVHAQEVLQASMTQFVLYKFLLVLSDFSHIKKIKDRKSHATDHSMNNKSDDDIHTMLDITRMSHAEKKVLDKKINYCADDICVVIKSYFTKGISSITNDAFHPVLAIISHNVQKCFSRIDGKKGKEKIDQLVKECREIMFNFNNYYINANIATQEKIDDDTIVLDIIEYIITALNKEVEEMKKKFLRNSNLSDDRVLYLKKYIFANLIP